MNEHRAQPQPETDPRAEDIARAEARVRNLTDGPRLDNGIRGSLFDIMGATPSQAGPRLGTVQLVIDGAAKHTLGAWTVVGRNPTARRESETIIAVTDLARKMSNNHFAIEHDPRDGFFIRDLGSTNGTALHTPAGVTLQLEPEVRMPLPIGAQILVESHVMTVVVRKVGTPDSRSAHG
ncbi:FHA domain-containing protein [Klugiella xanthotipulae]|uniref:FHA domain-containing protein n=1 Tax=Klugiella xanthotipulae TaxID=244735 RepID=A0A543I5W7_9MICO|nr:FHA domain-containing protein [Klugiella xanthotipulae]TQM65969.1 FHA domain-containing protein [Klugiella xanthotipulae]